MKINRGFKEAFTICILIFFAMIFFISCSTTTSSSPDSESSDEQSELFPAYINKDGRQLWGLIDSSGSFAIKPEYQFIGESQQNGLIRVYKDNYFGIIDGSGSVIVKPEYQYIHDYSDGIAIAMSKDKYYAFNESGDLIFESSGLVGSFKEGLAWFQSMDKNNSIIYGYIDLKGKVVLPEQYAYATDFVGGRAIVRDRASRYLIINTKGEVIYQTADKVLYEISEEMVAYLDYNKNQYGYMSIDGRLLGDAMFSYAGAYQNGLAIVGVSDSAGLQKFGIINKKGEFVVEPDFSSISSIGEDMFAVSLSSLYSTVDLFSSKAIMDNKGKILTGYSFFDIGSYKDGIVSVCDGASTYFIDKGGSVRSDIPKLEGAGVLSIKGKVIAADIDDELIYLDKTGKVIWAPVKDTSLNSGIVIREIKYRPNRFLLVKYPELNNMRDKDIEKQLNEELMSYFIGEQDEHSHTEEEFPEDVIVGYTVGENNDLLIFQMDAYVYPIGAAHGLQIKQSLHINSRTGKLYMLEDLFKKGSFYTARLTSIINARIKESIEKGEYLYTVESIEPLSPENGFTVKEDALVIYFQQYEIAPYAAGLPEFEIPFGELESIIDKNGDFWRSFKE